MIIHLPATPLEKTGYGKLGVELAERHARPARVVVHATTTWPVLSGMSERTMLASTPIISDVSGSPAATGIFHCPPDFTATTPLPLTPIAGSEQPSAAPDGNAGRPSRKPKRDRPRREDPTRQRRRIDPDGFATRGIMARIQPRSAWYWSQPPRNCAGTDSGDDNDAMAITEPVGGGQTVA